jgi:hypothetical protein
VLIDDFLPRYHFNEYHSLRVDADPERIYEAVRHGELAIHPVVRALLFLRGLGRGRTAFSLELFLKQGFVLLAENPPREIVLGIEGPFWKPSCKLGDPDFGRPVPPGVARGIWNFAIADDGTVSTETRVLCGEGARGKFRAYWLVVRPFSGLIRRLMLQAIRKQCTT